MSQVVKLENGRYAKPCPRCKKQQTYLRRNYAMESERLGKTCKVCSNRMTDNCHRGMYEDIRLSWVTKCRVGATTRGHEWCLSVEEIWSLYEAQGGKCALSGFPISWAKVGQNHSASIDRIDSSAGYVIENVQLVHKDVNMMKQSFSNERFIEVAKAVADKVKW